MSEVNLLIENVWIADGTLSPLRKGCVLISGGEISAILPESPAGLMTAQRIDGRKKILAPGFIDVHGHSDISIIAAPEGFSKISQGITTEICGNCGLSAFPLSEANREHIRDLYASYGVDIDWSTRQEYLDRVNGEHPSLQLIPLCGHNTLRAAVCGYGSDPMSGNAITEMRRLLSLMMQEGSPGLSTGLIYVPGRFADMEEITTLMQTVSAYNGIYTTHLRSEGGELLEALSETIEAAKLAGLKKLHISHFKTAHPENWNKLEAALDMLAEAEKSGIHITIDRYPYCESMSQLSVILPSPWDDLDDISLQKKLADPETVIKVADELRNSKTPEYWQRLRLAATGAAGRKNLCGKTFAEISPDPAMTVVELLAADAPGTTFSFAGMSEDNMMKIIALDNCMMGSDGNALPADGSLGSTHPRSSGSAAEFLRRLINKGISIERAIHKMTGLAAATFAIGDRGEIAAGKNADLVLFDPDEIGSRADFLSPFTPADGIICTVSKGKVVYHR